MEKDPCSDASLLEAIFGTAKLYARVREQSAWKACDAILRQGLLLVENVIHQNFRISEKPIPY